ncbi:MULTISPECIES: TRAP transporter small permease [Stappiaceae]|uniref:TRAP transporter small permease protein n=1 Tax=Roseibium aggregatum TaxID=187304 RepID=A0A0M6Y9G4_9HYPH|nr:MULTISPECIES: TRAP transporter small permease [Stappiaceae]MBO6856551.1 TRAP transporter small permease [Roseibium sp.]MBO9458001.1 TRAP transporter small permease [Labrenzia sp. R5_0]QFT70410.1 2,3-diketo-L-gulonate TRAP transporter small permease protein YiaM [Labrenzia sp. THAF35]UES52050.1 TRAP transporter small permease subunit [Roseibium aggregatum]UFI05780.1 TRAP transporter small permease [Roseibium aggregatum]
MDYRDHYPAALRWLSHLVDICLALGGFSIVTLVFCNAWLRGFAGFDLAWSLEVTSFLLLWSTFIGCAAAVARGAHMRVTEVVEKLVPLTGQRVLSIAIDVIIVVLLLSLIYTGVNISVHTWAQKTTVLYWPVGLLYASMPAGMTLTLIFHLFNMVYDLKNPVVPHAAHSDGGEALS